MTTIANLLPNGDTKRILANWVAVNYTLQSKLREAGLIASSTDLNARAAGAGHITSVPFYNPLAGDSVVGSDVYADKITPSNVTGDELKVARQIRNASWAGARLASLMSGLNVMTAVGSGLAKWRALDEQKNLYAYLKGIEAAAVTASDAGMLAGSASAKLDFNMVVDAGQTKGELKDLLDTLIVHSAVHAQLVKDDKVANIPASATNTAFESYAGKRLIVSDAVPTATANSVTTYTSVLTAPGIFQYGEAEPEGGAIAVKSDEDAGNGSGGDQLIYRRQFIVGVNGYDYKGPSNPTNTQLSAGTAHERKFDAALIPLVFISSKI